MIAVGAGVGFLQSLALLARFATGRRRWKADINIEFVFLFLGCDEVIEVFAVGEPFLTSIDVDVINGQPPFFILPFGVHLEADSAAFEGDDRFLERGQHANETGHLLAVD